MRAWLLTAIILGLLFMPVYAQAPKPEEIDTTHQAVKPDVTSEQEEPEQATEEATEPVTSEETIESQKAAEPETSEEATGTEEPTEAEPVLSVEDMAFCAEVADREPVSRDSTFSPDIGQIICWTNVLNGGGEGSVEHVWYYNGEEMARVELPAKYSRNRIWSSKKILPDWTGKWTVAVMAGSKKLGEMTCTVE